MFWRRVRILQVRTFVSRISSTYTETREVTDMRTEKWYLYFDNNERRLLIHGLNTMRYRLIDEGKHTDMVDDVLAKIMKAKKKKFRVQFVHPT